MRPPLLRAHTCDSLAAAFHAKQQSKLVRVDQRSGELHGYGLARSVNSLHACKSIRGGELASRGVLCTSLEQEIFTPQGW